MIHDDVSFKMKMSQLEDLLGAPYGSFVIHIWDDCYIMGTDTFCHMVNFPYPMYRDEAIDALLYKARKEQDEQQPEVD